MASEVKKIGEMLLEAEIITPSQLQEALRHQRIAGGRMGSNLVALGFVSENVLMDFLAQQTGVPRLDVDTLEVPPEVLQLIPRRLAEQLHILPVAVREPKTLVLAMTDPSDLNAVDSARFASGLNVEPMVVSVSALMQAIGTQYRKLELMVGDSLEIPASRLAFESLPIHRIAPANSKYARDPFLDVNGEPLPPPPPPPPAKEAQKNSINGQFTREQNKEIQDFFGDQPAVIPARPSPGQQARKLDDLPVRTLLMGLVRVLENRGIIEERELQRVILAMMEKGEFKELE